VFLQPYGGDSTRICPTRRTDTRSLSLQLSCLPEHLGGNKKGVIGNYIILYYTIILLLYFVTDINTEINKPY
jgi:hypothetical protein